MTLTDLYPNVRTARGSELRYEAEPVDARAVPPHLIVVADATSRRWPIMLASLLLVPVLVLGVTPFVRPFSGP